MHLQENNFIADRYRLIRFIGRGGFSEVWFAEDTRTGIFLAIKIFAPGVGLDDDGIRLFSREFSLVFNFNHSHLLRPMHYDVHNRMPFLIMPFCERGSATQLTGQITESQAWQFLRDVASGLAYLHGQASPVIHQDIKPDNVLIDSSGSFLITDFGISAKVRSTLRKSIKEHHNTSGGTIAYMAPERFGKDNMPVKASDVWSLGATLFELLVGDTPFGEHGGLIQKSGAEIPNIHGNYSNDLKSVVERCLAKDTWDRPTAEQLAELAARHIEGEPASKTQRNDYAANQPNSRQTVPRQPEPDSHQAANIRECPHCKSRNVNRVIWNFWGGLIGAAIVREYRCNDCKQNFRDKEKGANDGYQNSQNPKRNGFVTFWLWVLFFVGCYFCIRSTVINWRLYLDGYPSNRLISVFLDSINVLCVLSIVCLLRNLKLGFWMYMVSIILGKCVSLVNIITMNALFILKNFNFWTGIILVAALFGILQIKNNGISSWKALRKVDSVKDKKFFVLCALFFPTYLLLSRFFPHLLPDFLFTFFILQ